MKIATAFTYVFIFFMVGCANQAKKTEGIVDIQDVRNSAEPKENTAAHKAYDIEVYKTIFILNQAYKVFYYRQENDSLKSYQSIYGNNDDFDKAAYKWVNDTTVAIRLFNSTSNKEAKFTVFGKGVSSGMTIDK